jgi:PAS domain S-box-containing protein
MKMLSPRNRIALGLTGAVVAVVCMAKISGLIVDSTSLKVAARAELTETIALSTSGMIMNGQSETLESFLSGVVQRNEELTSAGIRDSQDILIFESGDHSATWNLSVDEKSNHSQMQVPVFKSSDEKWGTIELQFQPIRQTGLLGLLQALDFGMMFFIGSSCFLIFNIVLRLVLKHLDPSNAVPQRVRDALNNLAEGLMIIDTKSNILLVNSSLADVMGTSSDSLVGRKSSQLDFQCEPDLQLPWETAIAEKRLVSNARVQLTDREGKTFIFLANCSPLLGHQGNYCGVMVTLDDVTQLEESRIQLRMAKDAADAANQAKSDFLANMSHEIRTPMNAILGFTDVLRKGMEENPSQRIEYLNTIHSSGNHLIELINDILDLSKVEAGKLELESRVFSVPELLHESINVLKERAQNARLNLSFQILGQIPAKLTLDSTRLRQILLNLLGNAIKFTKEGSVTLSCGHHDGQLLIEVTDTGIGMTADQQERIFEAFSQADSSVTRRFGGTGLGLSISKRIVEAMQGTIRVESKSGHGSKFLIALPADAGADIAYIDQAACESYLQAKHSPCEDEKSYRLNPATVLIVDDGATNRNIVSVVLKRHNLNIIEAENGEEAVTIAMTQDVDVILMDMQMPVMDGYEATQTLRELDYSGPIIALTGNATSGERQRCLEIGCHEFLPKPIDIDQMIQLISKFTGFSDELMASSHSTAAKNIAASQDRPHRDAIDSQLGSIEPWTSTLPMDDPEFRDIVVQFSSMLPEKLGEMMESILNKNTDKLKSQAHWLKGAAGTVGLGRLTAPAAQLETFVESGDWSSCKQQMETIVLFASAIETAPADAGAATL